MRGAYSNFIPTWPLESYQIQFNWYDSSGSYKDVILDFWKSKMTTMIFSYMYSYMGSYVLLFDTLHVDF